MGGEMTGQPQREATELWRAIVALDGVIEADDNRVVTRWNERASELLGWTSDEATGQLTLADLVDDSDHATLEGFLAGDGITVARVPLTLIHREGDLFAAEVSIASGPAEGQHSVLLVFRPHPSIGGELDNGRADLLAPRATVDELLAPADRSPIVDGLETAFERDRGAAKLAVLCLELDPDTIGNLTTERALTPNLVAEIFARLQVAAGQATTVARLPEGRFVVVLDGLAASHRAANVAERIGDAFRPTGADADDDVRTTVSIGIGFLDDAGIDRGEAILEHAEAALDEAQAQGGDRYEIFDEANRGDIIERLRVREELYESIDAGSFRLHYQPVVNFESGAVAMVEALVRWEHPTRGLVAAGEFISLAEEHDLILPLGAWVLNEVCGQLRDWYARFADHTPVIAVNFSAEQFHHPTAVAQIAGVVEANDIEPRLLSIELSEDTLMQDAETSVAVLEALREVGVSLSIDHFGMSSSSFNFLQRFPVDVVKIDRSFVDGIDTNTHHEAVATAIIHLARSLGLDVTAEGIETEAQFALVRDLGCDSAQGYHVGRPQPPEEVASLFGPLAPGAGASDEAK